MMPGPSAGVVKLLGQERLLLQRRQQQLLLLLLSVVPDTAEALPAADCARPLRPLGALTSGGCLVTTTLRQALCCCCC